MTVRYEWDVESVQAVDTPAREAGDVLEHYFQNSASECVAFVRGSIPRGPGLRLEVVLVRDDTDGRSWAYADMATLALPECFMDAIGDKVARVPKRFHLELQSALR